MENLLIYNINKKIEIEKSNNIYIDAKQIEIEYFNEKVDVFLQLNKPLFSYQIVDFQKEISSIISDILFQNLHLKPSLTLFTNLLIEENYYICLKFNNKDDIKNLTKYLSFARIEL